MERHRVVIVGGGFGGLHATRSLARCPVEVTLIDQRNFHLFQPLLYQVATGALSPANIAAPLRAILASQRNARVLMGRVTAIDLRARALLVGPERLPYDTVILATGAGKNYFGNNHWEELAPSLKTVEDATNIRHRILAAFEAAEWQDDPEVVRALLTFVVVGGGPTGVEMAGAIKEIAAETLRGEYRTILTEQARIVLVEGTDKILGAYPEPLSRRAREALEKRRIEVLLETFVTDIRPDGITMTRGEETFDLNTRTVIWAAGTAGSLAGSILEGAADVRLDRAGRVMVEPDLSIPGHPEVFVIGDAACCRDQGGTCLPGVAQVAMQQGRHVARTIRTRVLGRPTPPPFRYRDRGNMATIGRHSAVVDLPRLRMWGYLAWILWLLVHLMMLVQFGNKVLVLAQWAWNYITRDRSARLIMGKLAPPPDLGGRSDRSPKEPGHR